MSYKGNDLDLRTLEAHFAETRAENRAEFGPDPGGDLRLSALQMPLAGPAGRQLPIPVDRTVLACCNQAYDIAAFHAAAEVRPEHLLHALTRVEAARDILEKHGLRTDVLRRDSAIAIAAEPPTRGAGTPAIPRDSAALEQLLRRAGAVAGADSVAASVHDLMRALLSQGRETAWARMFLAAAADPAELERWAAQPFAFRPGPAGAALQPEAVQMLMARVESLEAALGAQAAEAAADRRAMLDLMADLRREVRATRAETHPAVTEAQAALTARLDGLGQSVAQLAERFEAIRVFAPEGGDMTSRLTALETGLAGQPAAIADAVAFMLNERRAAAAEEPAAPDPTAERLAALEAMARTQGEQLVEAAKAREHDRDELHEALVKLGTNQQTLASNLEAWRLDNGGDISIVSNRLEALERRLQEASARRWRLRLPASEADNGSNGRTHSFKRWLNRTGEMLPSTWRHDAAALRQSLRVLRRDGKT